MLYTRRSPLDLLLFRPLGTELKGERNIHFFTSTYSTTEDPLIQ